MPTSWFGCCSSYVRCYHWAEGHTRPLHLLRWGGGVTSYESVFLSFKILLKTSKIFTLTYSSFVVSPLKWHYLVILGSKTTAEGAVQ